MPVLFHDLIQYSSVNYPNSIALTLKDHKLSYQELQKNASSITNSLKALNIEQFDRVGIYLPKTFEAVSSFIGISQAGGVFVPVNPVLKSPQVTHIIEDCSIKILITNSARLLAITHSAKLPMSLTHIIVVDGVEDSTFNKTLILSWSSFLSTQSKGKGVAKGTGNDIAAILYTSGSTGKPKGVVLSHRNLVEGAKSVAKYLHNSREDNIMALLPLSFDYGLSQLTTSFLVGANCILFDYLLASDIPKAITKHNVTGLAAVPTLWAKLCNIKWPKEASNSIRYFTNSGGAMTSDTLAKLRKIMPLADPYLMYGLTEAFRSTYLHPSEIDKKVGSIGKAIPNAEVLVLKSDGTECKSGEIGELVHKGPLVSLGYWNKPIETAKHFKNAPKKPTEIIPTELAVWSGDYVKKDNDGYIYFVARHDDMIKSSGYRLSPLEVEEALFQHSAVLDCAVIGVPHSSLGQAILAIVNSDTLGDELNTIHSIQVHCQKCLPTYMYPKKIIIVKDMPYNSNGKVDRNLLKQSYANYIME